MPPLGEPPGTRLCASMDKARFLFISEYMVTNSEFFAKLLRPISDEKPYQIGFLLVPGFSNLTLAAGMEPLRALNRIIGKKVFIPTLLSVAASSVASSSGIDLDVHGHLDDLSSLDALFVVASFDVQASYSERLFAPLRRFAALKRLTGGFEIGAYILGKAGLLNGKKATAHWEDLEDFQGQFPDALAINERYVIDRNFVTTSGALPTLDFIIHLARVQFGLPTALDLASMFIYEQDNSPMAAQRIVSVGRFQLMEPKLAQAIEIMQANLSSPLAIGAIAKQISISERSLLAKFRGVVGISPVQYYRWLRLSAAKRLLERTDLAIAEVADATGFCDRTSFTHAFAREFMTTPARHRKESMF